MSQKEIRAYLAKIGQKGGKVSRRTLTKEQARDMAKRSARVRKAKAKPHANSSA